MPAAIAVPLIIGAAQGAAQLYGAKKGADASKTAATQQIASVNKAQDFTQQAWEAQQKALNPYQQAGQYSLAALMARQYGGKLESYLPPQNYGAPPQMPQRPSPFGPPPPAAMSLAALQNRGTQNMNAGQIGMANIPPQFQPMAGHTPMLGPDGSFAHVPHDAVQEAIRRGARLHEMGVG